MFYAKLITVNVVLSFLVAGCIFFFFNYPISLLLTHTLICLSAYLVSFVFSLAVGVTPKIPPLRLMPLLFSVCTTILIFVYLGNWVSNHFWKANLNFSLINRMVVHYYQVYQLETLLIVCVIPLMVFFAVHLLYVKVYRAHYFPLKRPIASIMYTLSLLLFIAIQTRSFYNNSNYRTLNAYFYGELVLDLFNKYTDSHNDYIANADEIADQVVHSVSYIEQSESTIQINKKNIVFIVVDCLRADHLPDYGYSRNTTPFISDLVKSYNSLLVDNFYSMCDESKCGIRSILTSRGFRRQNSVQASRNSLHSKLKEYGYQINFLLTSDHAFGGLKKIYHPSDFYMDGIGFKAHPLNDDRGIVSTVESWPEYNGTPNYFHFHLFSAHEAGISYGKYLGEPVMGIRPGFLVDDSVAPRYSTENPIKHQKLVDRQDNKIFQADLVISRILNLLKEKGYMKNTLIVITGDHGQGLYEHGYYGHISGLYNESLHIPLILVNTSDDSLYFEETTFGTQLDIAPTILNILDKPIPSSWEGKALQQKKHGPQVTQHVIPNRSSSFAKIFYDPSSGALYKYIFLSTVGGLKEERLFFDLVNDPDEKNNLLNSSKIRDIHLDLIRDWNLDSYDS